MMKLMAKATCLVVFFEAKRMIFKDSSLWLFAGNLPKNYEGKAKITLSCLELIFFVVFIVKTQHISRGESERRNI